MEEWKEYRLGDIATIKGGKRLPKGVNLIKAPNNHPYIRVQDLGHEKTLELTHLMHMLTMKLKSLSQNI